MKSKLLKRIRKQLKYYFIKYYFNIDGRVMKVELGEDIIYFRSITSFIYWYGTLYMRNRAFRKWMSKTLDT